MYRLVAAGEVLFKSFLDKHRQLLCIGLVFLFSRENSTMRRHDYTIRAIFKCDDDFCHFHTFAISKFIN